MTGTSEHRYLPRSPISEAILDVQVEARDGFRGVELAILKEQLREEFPTVAERRRFQATFGPSAAGPMPAKTADLGLDGYLFTSADGKDVTQMRVDGFTLNRLAPYQGWSEWFPRFVRLWELYAKTAKPLRAVRLAARCINVVPIRPDTQLDEYLVKPPDAPDGLPSLLKSLVWRAELSAGGEPERQLALVQILQPAPNGQGFQLILDIDAFIIGDVPIAEVARSFDPLHILRNEAFFRSLTPKTIAGFA